MRAELSVPLGALWSFLLVLTRVGSALALVPLPGIRGGPEPARVVLALGFTAALYPLWPPAPAVQPGPGQLLLWLAAEAAFGLSVGVAVAFLNEGLLMACQILGLQAGYSYAAMVDPSTQADSNVLQVMAHLLAGWLFFAFGLDRQVLRIFAQSFEAFPPGGFALRLSSAQGLLALGAGMFSTGLRLALPVVALMTVVDITLALLGRVHAQMQLLMLAFPVKMLAALALLAAVLTMAVPLFRAGAERTMTALAGMLARAPGM
jgi:flagellar biosynthetic protein FliR